MEFTSGLKRFTEQYTKKAKVETRYIPLKGKKKERERERDGFKKQISRNQCEQCAKVKIKQEDSRDRIRYIIEKREEAGKQSDST